MRPKKADKDDTSKGNKDEKYGEYNKRQNGEN